MNIEHWIDECRVCGSFDFWFGETYQRFWRAIEEDKFGEELLFDVENAMFAHEVDIAK